MEDETFTLLRRFQYSSEAVIYQGKLESQGIEVFLRDNHTVDSNPLYSNAVGGVKLFVKTKDFERAESLLAEVSLYSVDDENQPINCPQCGAEEVDVVTSIKDWKSFMTFIFSMLIVLMPFRSKHKYKCDQCKFEFN